MTSAPPVRPSSRIINIVKYPVRHNTYYTPSSKLATRFDGRDARQKQVRSRFGRHKTRETCKFDRRASLCLRDYKNALRRILSATQWILRLRVKPNAPGEFAVIYPLSQHELILVFDVRVNKMKEHPVLHTIIGFRTIIGRPVRQTATNQPVRIVAAAGQPLARDWLTSRIDAAYVCTHGTEDPPRISRTISLHILEIVQFFGHYPSRRAIRVR